MNILWTPFLESFSLVLLKASEHISIPFTSVRRYRLGTEGVERREGQEKSFFLPFIARLTPLGCCL
jgi:hypothetical protein